MTEDLDTLRELYAGLKGYARQKGGEELRARYGQPDAAPVEGANGGEPDVSETGEGEGGIEPGRAEEEAAIAAMLAEGV